jgi:hypothetical protein
MLLRLAPLGGNRHLGGKSPAGCNEGTQPLTCGLCLAAVLCCALQASLATLGQNLQPRVSAPGVDWIVEGIAKRQINNMMHDLRVEVQRINAGAPIIPCPLFMAAGRNDDFLCFF